MARKVKSPWRRLKLPHEYKLPLKIGEEFFSSIFEFENGLRLSIYNYLGELYGPDWWEKRLKFDLPNIYNYAKDRVKEKNREPLIGLRTDVEVLPIHFITLGYLEEIVKKYKSECIPELFPNLRYFNRQMIIVKKFRNFCFHVFPGLTKYDYNKTEKVLKNLSLDIAWRF